ncbi:MAG: hypothetical protein ACLPYS_18535 [Vulcanimicrobiaceae bacterium]
MNSERASSGCTIVQRCMRSSADSPSRARAPRAPAGGRSPATCHWSTGQPAQSSSSSSVSMRLGTAAASSRVTRKTASAAYGLRAQSLGAGGASSHSAS